MAVIYQHTCRDVPDVGQPPWRCLECGGAIDVPDLLAWFWRGYLDLVTHPVCAGRLGPHMIADAREGTLAANPEQRWRRPAASLFRQRFDHEGVAA